MIATMTTGTASSGDVAPRDDIPAADFGSDALEAWRGDGEDDDDSADMQMWVVKLAGQPDVNLFRCYCHKWQRRLLCRRCDYHRADWQLILDVVVGAFRAEFGDGPVDRGVVLDHIEPRIDNLLHGRRRRLERLFAASLLTDPVYATAGQWVNGQHRSHAARQAGGTHILVGG